MDFDIEPQDTYLCDPLPDSPLPIIRALLDDAGDRSGLAHPDAMALATVGQDGQPAVRMVLCRGFDVEFGFFVFFTNRESRKGRQLAAVRRAALVFYWDRLNRQVRAEGIVVESPAAESDAYFAGRPRLSQIAAWASAQSQPIDSRESLIAELRAAERRLGGEVGPPIARPPFWGGYRLYAERIEIWAGSPGRAHDRVEWSRSVALVAAGDGDGADPAGAPECRASAWTAARLQP